MNLLQFQNRFVRKALNPGIRTAALSLPRGNGKSSLAGYLISKVLPTLARGQELALCAASIEQARITFRFARGFLGEAGYRYQGLRYAMLDNGQENRRKVAGGWIER